MWCLYLSLFHLLLDTELKCWQPEFPVWDPGPWLWREQSRPSLQIMVSVLTCLGATGKADATCSSLFHLTQNTGCKSGWCFSKMWQGKLTNAGASGKRLWVGTHEGLSKAQKQRMEYILWKIRTFRSINVYGVVDWKFVFPKIYMLKI